MYLAKLSMFNIDTAHRPMPYCVLVGQTHFSIYDYFQIVQNNNLPCYRAYKYFFRQQKKPIVFKKTLAQWSAHIIYDSIL